MQDIAQIAAGLAGARDLYGALRRAGTAQDIANAYLWLASDEANFISGVTLRVDGGILVGT